MRFLRSFFGPAASTSIYDFGGVIVFWVLLKAIGLKAALAGTLLFVAFDIWRRRRYGIGFPKLYILTTALAVVFGVVDLCSRKPFMLRFEGTVSTFLIACFFVVGARGKSVLEELITQQAGSDALAMPHARRFFQLFTLVWALYYYVMSAFYLWVSLHFPYLKAIGIRQASGIIGLVFMILLSLNMQRVHGGFRRIGLLPML